MPDYSVIGQSPNRVDALDKVLGRAVYSADIALPDMLHGKVLRSPYAHARIKRIDLTKASGLPGVIAVVTAKDVPLLQDSGEVVLGMYPGMAKDKVVFAGQPVAAVAAVNPHIAEEAVALIEVEYEPMEAAVDVLDAMKPEAPVVYPSIFTQGLAGEEKKPSNVFMYLENIHGNVEAGFSESDVIVENTFRTQTVHQGHLEPRASVADIAPDGKITIWTDNQGIFKARDIVAEFLKVPLNRIRVVPVEVGGAFGNKEHQQLSPLCALLAQKTGRPVKMVMTREEVFKATRPAAASAFTVKVGATKDGRLTAVQASIVYDFGAHTGMPGMGEIPFGSITGFSPYRFPNYEIRCYDVITNKAPSGPYRAPTANQAAFAVESQIDEIARQLGMDPLEFRLKNAVAEGDHMVSGAPYGRIGFKETLQTMQQYLAQRSNPEKESRGRGVACGLWLTGAMGSAAHINMNTDGTAVLVVGSTDISGTRTTLAQMAAEELGLPFSSVTVVAGDTETAAFSTVSVGSMTTRSMGIAVYRACLDVKEQLCHRAAGRLELEPADVEFVQGRVQVKGDPSKYVPMSELVEERMGAPDSGPITGRGAGEGVPEITPVFAVQAADVEVDKDTGKVKILSFATAQDTGLAINPRVVAGQMQGAAVQGIGWALMENYVFQEGVMQNATLLDYQMPTAADVPFIDALLVEVNSKATPFGIRGVGEPPMVPTLATIANAIRSATGIRFKELPMTPEVILRGIKAHQEYTGQRHNHSKD